MNWGTKLTIGLSLFMGFIVTLVVLMIAPHKADALIETDYYERGQAYDTDYNQKEAAKQDGMIPIVDAGGKGLTVRFAKPVTYELELRRLSDSKFDKSFKDDSATNLIFIPAQELESGSWLLRIRYQVGGEPYFYQNKILLP
jgi:nitrogen fixation protein FixH